MAGFLKSIMANQQLLCSLHIYI